ncbi:MAG: acylneuraminate cytidylyltransferase family protein [Elusimicrobia bacterium]|nr:acylneuraminate cytidylyltransferase family protein [Elusimicrobiota bacterium]
MLTSGRSRLLGVIPARGGSKGIPGKNIKPLAGVPLIGRTIAPALESGCFDRLWVSTDDPAIARVAARLGVAVPWLRPARYARDSSATEDAVLHLLGRLRKDDGYVPDAVMLLQPTSPFRTAATIRRAVDLFKRHGGDPVVSVAPARQHPCWCSTLRGGILVPFVRGSKPSRRQDLPEAYCYDGSIYLVKTEDLLERRSFLGPRTRALVVPEAEAVDIDTPLDWAVAEALWAKRRSRSGRRA